MQQTVEAKRRAARKVALVTGSGKRRVGWHLAQALAQRGYNLAVHYHSSAVEAAETVASLRGHDIEVVNKTGQVE